MRCKVTTTKYVRWLSTGANMLELHGKILLHILDETGRLSGKKGDIMREPNINKRGNINIT